MSFERSPSLVEAAGIEPASKKSSCESFYTLGQSVHFACRPRASLRTAHASALSHRDDLIDHVFAEPVPDVSSEILRSGTSLAATTG